MQKARIAVECVDGKIYAPLLKVLSNQSMDEFKKDGGYIRASSYSFTGYSFAFKQSMRRLTETEMPSLFIFFLQLHY